MFPLERLWSVWKHFQQEDTSDILSTRSVNNLELVYKLVGAESYYPSTAYY